MYKNSFIGKPIILLSLILSLAFIQCVSMQSANAAIKSKGNSTPKSAETPVTSKKETPKKVATEKTAQPKTDKSSKTKQGKSAKSKTSVPESRLDSSAYYKGDYVIGVGDNVMVSVWRNPDLSITVPVRPDGKISTPLVGDIQAAGNSPMTLANSLKQKLARFIRDPQVSVIMTGLNSHEYVSRVRITGAVGGPTSVPHRMGITVMDLILAAGGLSEFANGNKTVLYRTLRDGKQKTIKIKADDIWDKGKLDTNILLRPGDVVSVPESLF